MLEQDERTAGYRCPGQGYSISRAVHLGRLARFYPGCRGCPQRDDTGTLSARRVGQLVETRPRGLPRPLFHEEGAAGVYLNDLTPEIVREIAAALGVGLQRRDTLGNGWGTVPFSLRENRGSPQGDNREGPQGPPVVVIAGDGRPISCELVAAAGEGLRWAGCRVVDIGAATAACTTFAVDHLAAGGGLMVGNPDDRPHTVGLKFWAAGPRPLSAGGPLEKLQRLYEAGVDRPTRCCGSLRRFQAEVPYLAGLAGYYHALRPLRLVLDTACVPLVRYLKQLTEPVACRIVLCRTTPDRLAEVVRAENAHFAVRVGDDGETCRLFDEQGREVPAERLIVLLARHLLGEPPQRAIVLEEGTSAAVAGAIRAAGGRVVFSAVRRSEMAAAMQAHGGLLGGGASGRLWHDCDGLPLPDALGTLSLLLVLLSQSDRPLSEVLDRQAALG